MKPSATCSKNWNFHCCSNCHQRLCHCGQLFEINFSAYEIPSPPGPTMVGPREKIFRNRILRWLENAILRWFLNELNKKKMRLNWTFMSKECQKNVGFPLRQKLSSNFNSCFKNWVESVSKLYLILYLWKLQHQFCATDFVVLRCFCNFEDLYMLSHSCKRTVKFMTLNLEGIYNRVAQPK